MSYDNGENYISQKEWTKFLRRAMKSYYDPMVNIGAIYPKKCKSDLVASAKEVAKYQVYNQ